MLELSGAQAGYPQFHNFFLCFLEQELVNFVSVLGESFANFGYHMQQGLYHMGLYFFFHVDAK